MKKLEQNLEECDNKIIELLIKRINIVKELTQYKKKYKMPILQQEKETNFIDYEYEKEIEDIFNRIIFNSRKIQRKTLFSDNIILIGFMGVGKSTISAYLGKLLAMEEVEIDSLIEKKEGISIPEIFNKYGENYFRDCETDILKSLKEKTNLIVSCGGGIVLREENIEHMKEQGKIVLLTALPETILERVKNNTQRPILNNHMNIEFITDLMEKRRKKYEKAADIIISSDNKTALEICEELVQKVII